MTDEAPSRPTDPGTPVISTPADLGSSRCPECGYRLAGLASNTCPECGTPISLEAIERRRPTKLILACIGGLFVSGFVLSLTGVLSVIGVPMMLGAVVLAGSWPQADGPRLRFWLKFAAVAVWVPTVAVVALAVAALIAF